MSEKKRKCWERRLHTMAILNLKVWTTTPGRQRGRVRCHVKTRHFLFLSLDSPTKVPILCQPAVVCHVVEQTLFVAASHYSPVKVHLLTDKV